MWQHMNFNIKYNNKYINNSEVLLTFYHPETGNVHNVHESRFE